MKKQSYDKHMFRRHMQQWKQKQIIETKWKRKNQQVFIYTYIHIIFGYRFCCFCSVSFFKRNDYDLRITFRQCSYVSLFFFRLRLKYFISIVDILLCVVHHYFFTIARFTKVFWWTYVRVGHTRNAMWFPYNIKAVIMLNWKTRKHFFFLCLSCSFMSWWGQKQTEFIINFFIGNNLNMEQWPIDRMRWPAKEKEEEKTWTHNWAIKYKILLLLC